MYLYRPDHENGHQGVHPISYDTHDADRISGCYEAVPRHAMEVCNCEVPLSLNGATLENAEEKDSCRPNSYNCDAGFQSPLIATLDSKAEEEYGDGEFDEHHIRDI